VKSNKIMIAVVVALLAAGLIWWFFIADDGSQTTNTNQPTTEQPTRQEVAMSNQVQADGSNAAPDGIICSQFDANGKLKDVSGGNASGTAGFCYVVEGTFYMQASASNLPSLEDSYFYEGWLVNQSTGDFISTGKAEVSKKDTEQTLVSLTNDFAVAGKDYSDYNYYVLTLEPDDGDPAPAEHIVEGALN